MFATFAIATAAIISGLLLAILLISAIVLSCPDDGLQSRTDRLRDAFAFLYRR